MLTTDEAARLITATLFPVIRDEATAGEIVRLSRAAAAQLLGPQLAPVTELPQARNLVTLDTDAGVAITPVTIGATPAGETWIGARLAALFLPGMTPEQVDEWYSAWLENDAVLQPAEPQQPAHKEDRT